MAEQEDILPGNADVIRKADDWYACGPGNISSFLHMVTAQRAENDLVAIGHGSFGRSGHALRGVIGDQADVRDLGVRQRQRRRVGNRLADVAIGAGYRQQQGHAVQHVDGFRCDHRRRAATRTCSAGGEQREHCQNQQFFEPARYILRRCPRCCKGCDHDEFLDQKRIFLMSFDSGLYVVATPIGNLADMSQRAIAILEAADIVAVEDSRVTGKLLHHLGLKKKMRRYNDHSSESDRLSLVAAARDGVVALVSDAGTPLISDPGYKLVRSARAAGVEVFAAPGPSAAIAALSICGLPTDRFLFAGFLPSKAKARADALAELAGVKATLVFYESGPRLAATLAAIAEVYGDREVAVARELTKKFEEVVTGTAG